MALTATLPSACHAPRGCQAVQPGRGLDWTPVPLGTRRRGATRVERGALLGRMTGVVACDAGRVPRVTVSLYSVALGPGDAEQLIAAVKDGILGGSMFPHPRGVLRDDFFFQAEDGIRDLIVTGVQ